MSKANLSDRIHQAVLAMERAKNHYNNITRSYKSGDKNDDDYLNDYFEIQENCFSAVDVILNCFVEEKKIPVYKIKDRNFKTCLYGTDLTTKELCSSILFYNSQKLIEEQYLRDVDFDCLIKDKPNRNKIFHLGILKELQDICSFFRNLNKILLQIDAYKEKKAIDIEEPNNDFEFQTFQAFIKDSTQQRRFILIANSVHGINKEELEVFLRLPWSVIIDYDGASNLGGLKSLLVDRGINHNTYTYTDITDNNKKFSFTNRLVHIQMCDDDLRSQFTADINSPNPKDSTLMHNILSPMRGSSYPYATVVVLGNMTIRSNFILTSISGEFTSTDIILLSKQSETAKENFVPKVGTRISYVWSSSEVSVIKAIHSIFLNKEMFPTTSEYLLATTDSYKMPYGILIDRDKIKKVEKEVEFIHCGLGNNIDTQENAFYHGDLITWDAINNKCAAHMTGNYEKFLSTMMNASPHTCMYIHHLPGFGGTTLGRQLIWDIHEKIPCVRLKKFISISDFKRQLNDLYSLLDKKMFWILIDENDHADGDISDMVNQIKAGEYKVCALIVKRISDAEATKKQKIPNNEEIVLRLIDKKSQDGIESKCCNILNNPELFKKRRESLNLTLRPDYKCPLLINLYLLENDFKLDSYVERIIKKLPGNDFEDNDLKKLSDILAFLAIGSYYSNLRIPLSYINQYLGLNNYSFDPSYYEGVLLERNDEGVRKFCINHFMIAREILIQLLGNQEKEYWNRELPAYIKKYIDWLALLIHDSSCIDDEIIEIISYLFTDKTKSSQWIQEIEDSSYTFLLSNIDSYQRLDIMDYLSDKIGSIINKNIPSGEQRKEYRMLAHIYAQHARVRSESFRINENDDLEGIEKKNTELDKLIKQTKDLMLEEDIHDETLEDILGRCCLKRVEERKSHINSEEGYSSEDLNYILQYVDEARGHFDNTIWLDSPEYGIPGKLKALRYGIDTFVKVYNWRNDNLNDIINGNPKARLYVEEILSLFNDMEENELDPKSKTLAEKERDTIEKLLFSTSEEKSTLLEKLNNISEKLKPDDYDSHYFVSTQIVYAYERKYTNPGKYRRGALICKALDGDKKASEDAKKVFDRLDSIIKMNNSHTISSATFSKWFEYAKLLAVPLSRAHEVAVKWKMYEADNFSGRGIKNLRLIKPDYYLFVISLLQYLDGDADADSVRERFRVLNVERKKGIIEYSGLVRDWYTQGKGMGHLFSHEWIDVKDVALEQRIKSVKGEVVHFNEDDYTGYIKITDPIRLGNWGKPHVGSDYNRYSDVYFSESQTKLITSEDVGNGKSWDFKFGFSYDGLKVSSNSLEVLNRASKKIDSGHDDNSKEQIVTQSKDQNKSAPQMQHIPFGKKITLEKLTATSKGTVQGTFYFNGQELYGNIAAKYIGDINQVLSKASIEVHLLELLPSQSNKYDCIPTNIDGVMFLKPATNINFLPFGEPVRFYPESIGLDNKSYKGKVNGKNASLSKRFILNNKVFLVEKAIKDKLYVKAKIIDTNTQGNGYRIFLE